MVHRAGGSEPYVIQLVALDGHAQPAVHAMSRSDKTYFTTVAGPGCPCPDITTANYLMPEISVSSTRVYFLDGDADVKSLAPSGAVSLVTHLVVVDSAGLEIVSVPTGAITQVVGLTPLPQQGWPSIYAVVPASLG